MCFPRAKIHITSAAVCGVHASFVQAVTGPARPAFVMCVYVLHSTFSRTLRAADLKSALVSVEAMRDGGYSAG
jgi:hypothetical protein